MLNPKIFKTEKTEKTERKNKNNDTNKHRSSKINIISKRLATNNDTITEKNKIFNHHLSTFSEIEIRINEMIKELEPINGQYIFSNPQIRPQLIKLYKSFREYIYHLKNENYNENISQFINEFEFKKLYIEKSKKYFERNLTLDAIYIETKENSTFYE